MGHLAACEALEMSEAEASELGGGGRPPHQRRGPRHDCTPRGGRGCHAVDGARVYDWMLRRVFDGGGFTIETVGPREASIEMRDMPPFRFAYFRHAYRGASYAAMGRFCETLRVEEVPGTPSATGFTMRLSWT